MLAGCGSTPHSAAPSAATESAALSNSPAPLKALHVQANRLIAGGPPAFKTLMATVRGYPLVVNKWASWCGPCQSEFPAFQRAAVELGREVAFVGVDGKDADTAARAFLKRFPVSYPSYADPHERIAALLEATTYYPETVYVDRRGAIVYEHVGPYESASALERDIRRYVLGAG